MSIDRIIRRAEVCELTGLGKTYLDTLEQAGDFPRRRKLTARTYGWLSSEVQEWIRARPAVESAKAPL